MGCYLCCAGTDCLLCGNCESFRFADDNVDCVCIALITFDLAGEVTSVGVRDVALVDDLCYDDYNGVLGGC